jgi:protein-tyrosine phosphatase
MAAPAHYAVSDRLRAGAYPGTPEGVQALEDAGVTLFVDLTHTADPLEGYERHLGRSRRAWHPIPNFGTPTVDEMSGILDEVDQELAGGGSVYVHCWGGVGRTGTVIGCWLTRHGLERGDAVATLAGLRRALPDARPSPETEAQLELVRGWERAR